MTLIAQVCVRFIGILHRHPALSRGVDGDFMVASAAPPIILLLGYELIFTSLLLPHSRITVRHTTPAVQNMLVSEYEIS